MATRTSSTARTRRAPPGRTDGEATRAAIVAAAERLFAERGIDDVSLQEINRAARQRNRSAVQYHFGTKEGLIHAILDKHTPAIAERRREALDSLDPKARRDVRRLAEILVHPAAEKLDDPDGGIAFLRVNAELIGHPQFSLLHLNARRANPQADRLREWTARACPHLPQALWMPRWLLVTGLLFHGLADYARLAGHRRKAMPMPERAVFVSSLVDSVVALLEAPVSKPTRACLRARDRKEKS